MTDSRIHFTPDRIKKLCCPPSKSQQLFWDDAPTALGIRVLPSGNKSYIFEFSMHGRSGRVTIGRSDSWSIKEARSEAMRLQVLVDSGTDPRDERRRLASSAKASALMASLKKKSVLEAWDVYLGANHARWGTAHYQDHLKMVQAPGLKRKRSKQLTKAGALHPLMQFQLSELNSTHLAAWLRKEVERRPTVAALAYRLLRSFINWCGDHAEYKLIVSPSSMLTREVRLLVPSCKAKTDYLQREMLCAWFTALDENKNKILTAYLKCLLLTGARKGELAQLKWDDVDFVWNSLRLKDKMNGHRTIPLTPHVSSLLSALPKVNEWVFSSNSANGFIASPHKAHARMLASVNLPHISIHGIRRSFGSLAEWVECPRGVVEQIQGHRPTAISEKHYRQRPIDLLRVWHHKLESWLLEQASPEYSKRTNASLGFTGRIKAIN